MRIMFVCHGNICRSPMAEFILKKVLADAGILDSVEVSSSATSTEEIWGGVGNPMYPPAVKILKEHGIPCRERRAVLLQKGDYGKYDLFIGMDSANIINMHRIFGSDPDGKIRKMMEYTPRGGDVADPWYSGRFDIAYRDIYEGCVGLVEKIVKELKNDF